MLVTAGTHHLRFWSFRRPQANGLGGDVDGRDPSLKFKGGVYPRAGPAGGGLGGGGAVPSKPPLPNYLTIFSTGTRTENYVREEAPAVNCDDGEERCHIDQRL